MLCFTCGLAERRPGDSKCRHCRNEYVRLWKAEKRHGVTLNGYKPRAKVPEKKEVISFWKPKRKLS